MSQTGVWESDTTVAELAAMLRRSRRVACLTHSRPDGDAVGSSMAMVRTLIHLGIDARAFYVGPTPRWLAEVVGTTPHEVFEPAAPADPSTKMAEIDTVVVTDTGSWTQLSEVSGWLKGMRAKTIVLDHHLHGDADVSDHKLLGKKDAASTQVVAPLCAELLGKPLEKLPRDVAEPIYLGLATDTQWFRLSNVTPGTLKLAAALLEAGVDHTRLYELIEQRDSAARYLLMGRALSSLEMHAGGKVALMRLTLRDFDECGADRNDTGGFADMVQHIATVQVAAILTESDVAAGAPPVTKVSMRSKPGPQAVDVNAITRQLGGGGHARAAGAKMAGVPMEEARRRVLALVS